MSVDNEARRLLVKYRNVVPGPPPVLRALSDRELLSDFRETERIAATFEPSSSEAQIVGNVVRGWIGQEMRSRRFAREFPQLVG